jgi:hypothetical protein
MTIEHGSNERPARADLRVVMERLRELRRRRAPPAKRGPELEGEQRIAILEERINRLEANLEALQDALNRQSALQDERITDLRRRTAPDQMARSLSEDARRRGV